MVRAGSDRCWNRHPGDGGEYLDRCSMQRCWLDRQQYQLVLERAFLNHAASPWLPEHTEIYIRDDLGIDLART